MAITTMSGKIQRKHTSDVLCELSFGDTLHVSQREEGIDLPPGLRAGGGSHNRKEIQVDYE
eukprot:642463-Amphidinium_carterae.1